MITPPTSQSGNFGFLVPYDNALVGVASLAELYFPEDPVTCLMKLRQFGELLAQQVAARAGVFARQLAVWIHRTFGDRAFKPGPFQPPRAPPDPTAQLRVELDRLQTERVAFLSTSEAAAAAAARRAEDALQAQRTAEERAAAEAEERSVWEALATETDGRLLALQEELARVQAAAVAQPATLQLLANAANEAAQAIDLDEEATRSLIDGRLRARGWEADTPTLRHAAGARPFAGRNRAMAEWPTDRPSRLRPVRWVAVRRYRRGQAG